MRLLYTVRERSELYDSILNAKHSVIELSPPKVEFNKANHSIKGLLLVEPR